MSDPLSGPGDPRKSASYLYKTYTTPREGTGGRPAAPAGRSRPRPGGRTEALAPSPQATDPRAPSPGGHARPASETT